MKIYAPVKDANGTYASVMFVNGVGETDNPHLIEWFRNHGYKLEEDAVAPVEPTTVEEIEEVKYEPAVTNIEDVTYEINTSELDFESMTPNDLREYMMENGYGSKIRNTRNKEKLLEILRG